MISFHFSFRLGLHPDGVFSWHVFKNVFLRNRWTRWHRALSTCSSPISSRCRKNREKTGRGTVTPWRGAGRTMLCVSGQKRRVWTGQHRVAAEELRLHMSHPGHRLRPLAQGKVWKRKGRLSGNGKTGRQKFDIKKRNRIQPKSSCETWQALAWDLECCYTVIRTYMYQTHVNLSSFIFPHSSLLISFHLSSLLLACIRCLLVCTPQPAKTVRCRR